ncbi:MAG: hypothetical protein JXB50_16365 [Spirochaetes bacterium]|nr:hypothetical protein [Spirochaetota bacterium]
MKRIFPLIILLFFTIEVYCLQSPRKKKENSAVIGRAYIYLEENWLLLPKQNYYKIRIYLQNKITKRIYTLFTDKKGYFKLLNIHPGIYLIKKFDFYYTIGNWEYSIKDIKIYKKVNNEFIEGLYFGLHDKTITVINTIIICIEKYGENRVLPIYYRVDEKDEIINFFKKKDRRNRWTEYDFGEFESD